MKNLIQATHRLLNSADDTGCTDGLTVVDARALEALRDATKSALSEVSGLEAGLTGLYRTMLAVMQGSGSFGFSPEGLASTIERQHERFEAAKTQYEDYCKAIGQPAYVTYNED